MLVGCSNSTVKTQGGAYPLMHIGSSSVSAPCFPPLLQPTSRAAVSKNGAPSTRADNSLSRLFLLPHQQHVTHTTVVGGKRRNAASCLLQRLHFGLHLIASTACTATTSMATSKEEAVLLPQSSSAARRGAGRCLCLRVIFTPSSQQHQRHPGTPPPQHCHRFCLCSLQGA